MASVALDYETLDDRGLAARIAAGDSVAAALVLRRYNQRLFRTAWSVLKDRADAEEAVQEGYLKAFAAIDRFQAGSSLATWLTRIVVNEAISRLRAAKRRKRALTGAGVASLDDARARLAPVSPAASPEEEVMRRQLSGLLEAAIARLPEPFRIVFVLHEVEGLSSEEVAESLDMPVETVRTRLFRARRRLRDDLGPELKAALAGSFPFAGADCDALTARVLSAWMQARTATDPR